HAAGWVGVDVAVVVGDLEAVRGRAAAVPALLGRVGGDLEGRPAQRVALVVVLKDLQGAAQADVDAALDDILKGGVDRRGGARLEGGAAEAGATRLDAEGREVGEALQVAPGRDLVALVAPVGRVVAHRVAADELQTGRSGDLDRVHRSLGRHVDAGWETARLEHQAGAASRGAGRGVVGADLARGRHLEDVNGLGAG